MYDEFVQMIDILIFSISVSRLCYGYDQEVSTEDEYKLREIVFPATVYLLAELVQSPM